MSAEFRIVLYLQLVLLLFLLPDLGFYTGLFVLMSLCLITVPFRTLKAGWVPISMFLIFTFISNALYHTGKIIFSAGPVIITQDGLHLAVLRSMRIILMIGGVKFLMARTHIDDVVNALSNLLRPLERTGLPVKDFFHTAGLTLKCFPILKDTIADHYAEHIKKGVSKGMLSKAMLLAQFILPLFVESIHSPELFFPEPESHEEL